MKKFKKMMALVIAMVMVLAMNISVFADGETPAATTYTITMSTSTGHTYSAYQIFKGDLNEGTLSNIQWGDDVNGTALLAALKADETYGTAFKDCATAADVAKVIGDTYTSNSDEIAAIAKIIEDNKSGNGTSGTTSIAGLAAGYYLVVDSTDATSMPEGNTYSDFMLEVVKDVQVTAKDSTVESKKKVQDINDSDATPTLSGLQDSADYDIGDEIPYTLTFKLPSDYAKYDHYYVKFYDDMSKGLTYKTGSAKIAYGSNAAVAIDDPVAGTTTYEGGHMWTWEIMDLKALTLTTPLAANNVITLTYKAVLNGDAVIGSAGNPNKMQVEYSNNPNNTGDGKSKPDDTGKTPIDINIVFTYKTIFNKVQPDGDTGTKPLTGADFKLEKKVDGEWVDITTIHTGDGAINPTKTGGTTGSQFTFAGLDDGDYKLTETVTPAGFNSIDPIEFTITADHDIESDNPALKKINGSTGGTIELVAEPKQEATVDLTAASITSNILNQSGATLPSTGGIGTTIFYIIGAILVIGAGVVLVTRRRMSAN